MSKTVKKFIFVLMPFDDSFDDIYNFGIKQTCIELNTYCERVDEQIFNERILDRIYNQILKADLIVADMSMRNPNVFYEVGYAHGIGKQVILLTRNADDIPFDLKHFPHIVYDNKIKLLSTQLKKKIDFFLNENDLNVINDYNNPLEFLINGKKIEENSIIQFDTNLGADWMYSTSVKMDIYNNSVNIYKSKFKIGFEVINKFEKYFKELEIIKPSQEKVLLISKELENIYPNAYKSVEFKFHIPQSDHENIIQFDCKLQIFTSFELREINFKIQVNKISDDNF